jgi:hypothetical protein
MIITDIALIYTFILILIALVVEGIVFFFFITAWILMPIHPGIHMSAHDILLEWIQ